MNVLSGTTTDTSVYLTILKVAWCPDIFFVPVVKVAVSVCVHSMLYRMIFLVYFHKQAFWVIQSYIKPGHFFSVCQKISTVDCIYLNITQLS